MFTRVTLRRLKFSRASSGSLECTRQQAEYNRGVTSLLRADRLSVWTGNYSHPRSDHCRDAFSPLLHVHVHMSHYLEIAFANSIQSANRDEKMSDRLKQESSLLLSFTHLYLQHRCGSIKLSGHLCGTGKRIKKKQY